MNISATLSDALGNTSVPVVLETLASLRARIPFPDDDMSVAYVKSILQSVRIPLRAFTAGSALDLQRVTKVTLSFDKHSSGELIFDDVEFLGLDVTAPEKR